MLAKIKNNQIDVYPYNILDLYKDYPNVSFPKDVEADSELLAQYNVVIIASTPKPTVESNKKAVKGEVGFVDGAWRETWDIIDMSPEEIQFDIENKLGNILGSRRGLLTKTDWTQLPDSPLASEKKAEFATYRQAIRDLPTQPGYPDNITWPEMPQ